MTEQDLSNVFEEATMQALLYGVGFLRIQHANGDLIVSTVHRDEFQSTADHLVWLDQNSIHVEKQ